MQAFFLQFIVGVNDNLSIECFDEGVNGGTLELDCDNLKFVVT